MNPFDHDDNFVEAYLPPADAQALLEYVSETPPIESHAWEAALHAPEEIGWAEQTNVSLRMRGGGIVGNTSNATNVREDVLHALDRLHTLWSINNTDYGAEYPRVRALARGRRITNPDRDIPRTIAAIRQNDNATLHPRVARNFFEINLTATVGTGAPNHRADILGIQTILHAHGALSATDFTTENGAARAVSSGRVPEPAILRTIAGIRRIKNAIAGARLGWAPIHVDEMASGGDRFGSRTYQFQNLSIFVPRGTVAERNDVHVFFSPGGSQGESGLNAVLHHGLRGACEGSGWILIGVPGAEPGFVTVDTAQVSAALRHIGRRPDIHRLRLSGHSRGYRGLRETISRNLLDNSKIDRVVILDAGYNNLATALQRARIPPSKIWCYVVTVQALPVSGARNIRIPAQCARAVGYSRLIGATRRTRARLAIPTGVSSQLLTLPDRGQLVAGLAASGSSVAYTDFCRTNSARVTAIVRGETTTPNGLKTFFDTNDIGRLGSPFSAGIYSHHFFVAEIAHEITR